MSCKGRGFHPGSGRSPGGGHGNRLQYSSLENSIDRGARCPTVHRISKFGTTEHTQQPQQKVLKRRWFCLSAHLPMSRDIFVVTNWVGEKFCWHLEDRDQGCCYTPYNAKDSYPQQRTTQSKIPMVPRWRNLGLKVRRQWCHCKQFGVTHQVNFGVIFSADWDLVRMWDLELHTFITIFITTKLLYCAYSPPHIFS